MTTDSVRRQEIIDEYKEATSARAELARKQLRELKVLGASFVAEDKKLIRVLRACENNGEALGLFAFSVSESIDTEELRQPLTDLLDAIEEDAESVVELRREAKEADEEDDESEEEDSDDDGDEDDDEELTDEDGSPLEDDDD